LRLTHAFGSCDQGLSFTQGCDADILTRNAATDEFFRHCFSAAARQRLIILWRAGAIRMARYFKARGLGAGGFGGFTDDLARTRGQVSAIPSKNTRKLRTATGAATAAGVAAGALKA